jgi:hypothetical protein
MDDLTRFIEILKKADSVSSNDSPSAVFAKVSDINDPKNRGRCKVALESFTSLNGRISYSSDWSPVIGLNLGTGKLPKSLLNQQVLAIPLMNSYEYLTVQISGKLIYRSDELLPEPSISNLGLEVITLSSTESFAETVQLRNGRFIWEKTGPLKHLHKSGDKMPQQRDVSGDYQFDIEAQPTDDSIVITSAETYQTNSKVFPPSF